MAMDAAVSYGPSSASSKRAKSAAAVISPLLLFPEGQLDVILHILSFLPNSHKAAVAKLVCKAAYERFQQYGLIEASACAELPMAFVWDLSKQRRFHFSGRQLRMQLIAAVARQGDLARFQLLLQVGCNWDASVCITAAEGGQLDILQWLREQGPPCPWGPELCHTAARGGQLEVLQWLRAQDPPCAWDQRTCCWAARNGHMHVLQWARAQQPPCPWDARVTIEAAERGDLDTLQQALALHPPAPWQPRACAVAASHGHLHVLQWVAAQKPPLNWNSSRCMVLAREKHRADIVAWLQTLPADTR